MSKNKKEEDLQGMKAKLNKMSEDCLNQINTLQNKQKDFKLQLENCSKKGSNLNEQKEVLEVENLCLTMNYRS